jgi:hypothetical protein
MIQLMVQLVQIEEAKAIPGWTGVIHWEIGILEMTKT